MNSLAVSLEKIRNLVCEVFSNVTAVIVYGSTGDDYIPGVSDIDVIIVGPADDEAQKKLAILVSHMPELDPIYFGQQNIVKLNFVGKKINRDYELHKFDLYRIRTRGKILLGDSVLLELFPKVSLDEALLGTLPYIQEVFIPRLRNDLGGVIKVFDFIAEHLDILIVIIRAVYTIERNGYGSKIDAIEYLRDEHFGHADLLEVIRDSYLKQIIKAERSLSKDNIRNFIEMASEIIDGYLSKKYQ